MTTWIICPNLWGARLFYYGSPEQIDKKISFIHEFPRPKIQTKLEDFPSDEDMAEMTPPPEDPLLERLVAHKYMQYLAKELEQASTKNIFDSLIICAEPRLLSIFMEHLGPSARKRVSATIDQDLYEVNESDLAQYVEDALHLDQAA